MPLSLIQQHAKAVFGLSLFAYLAIYALLYYLSFDAVRLLQRETLQPSANPLVQSLCAEQVCTGMTLRLVPLPGSSRLQLAAEVTSDNPLAVDVLQQRYHAYKKTLPWRARLYLADDMQLTRVLAPARRGAQATHSKKKNHT